MLVVLLTLIIACANVTNLLLALNTTRRHEMLVRAALGASRVQLVAPMLRESVQLCLVVVHCRRRRRVRGSRQAGHAQNRAGRVPARAPLDLRPDPAVLAATLLVAIASGFAVGLAPAWRAASDGLSGAINRELAAGEPRKAKDQAGPCRHSNGRCDCRSGRRRRVHPQLHQSAAQPPLDSRPGSWPSSASISTAAASTDARVPRSTSGSGSACAVVPGVEAVTLADEPPMAGFARSRATEGEAPPPDGHGADTPYSVVDPSYFSTIGIDIASGRGFDSRDRPGTPEVVIVNATMARQRWPGGNPIGRRLRIENGNRLVHVIGVVPDGKYEDVTESPLPFMTLALPALPGGHHRDCPDTRERRAGPRHVTRALADMDPTIVFGGIGTMTLDDLLELSLLLPRAIVASPWCLGS